MENQAELGIKTTQDYLSKLYKNRFDQTQLQQKLQLWKVLIKQFLQPYIPHDSIILDIGGGYCEFINHVQGREKYLLDLNPAAREMANPDVRVLIMDVLDRQSRDVALGNRQFDVIFLSNFLEHLPNKEALVDVLLFCHERLNRNGCLLIIQPNFKYSYREYYDFIDHTLVITDRSLQEILQVIGFQIELIIPRFLPFSTKGRPSSPWLLSLYLRLPLLWQLLGGQLFVKASRSV